MIVLGPHGRRGPNRLLLGGISEAVAIRSLFRRGHPIGL